jgi:hypothetical protein
MSRDALLNYATPPRNIPPRANWLAVFSFAWTFGVAPLAILLYFVVRGEAAQNAAGLWGLSAGVMSLVGVPGVGLLSGFAATERGAAWDSGYRWTGFAVWAAPVAGAMTSGGVMFCLRALHVWSL